VSLPLVVFDLAFLAIGIAGDWAEGSESPKSLIRPCPNKPNCVSSRAPERLRRMDPIPYQGSVEEARQRLLDILGQFDRTSVVREAENYLKVEFRSAVCSFVDDVEFEFDYLSKLIHFRSASRLGYYDFGVNRIRMETVIRLFSGKESSG
jgi:uncharacterized protein (DUF1499 family)